MNKKMELRESREYFLKTERIGFSIWNRDDIKLAELLWRNPEVTRFICASGKFKCRDISNRLNKEIYNGAEYQFQYWPIFELETNDFIGCCGLKKSKAKGYL